MNRQVAIIHFNTPELTEAAIMSLRKHGGRDYQVTVFDNSTLRPFTAKMRGVTVVDNTKGQIIDFDAELEKFPNKCREIGCARNCEWGSAKHMITVQKLWDMFPDGFLLMESDILLKRDISEFFDKGYSFVGYAQQAQPYNRFRIGRVLPMLCYMNVPRLRKYGARYYDPTRTYGLLPGGRDNRNNWYDTGAVLLEDILNHRPYLKGRHIDIRLFLEHFGSASWRNNSTASHRVWLMQHRALWAMPSVAICAIGRMENRYAREWVEHYRQMGIKKIFIYDNNREGEERFEDVIQEHIDSGLVQIIPWSGLQKDAYEDCYNRHNAAYDWMGFFDFDEFVRIDRISVPEFLSGVKSDVLVMSWRTMTDNGHLRYEDKPVVDRFTEALPESYSVNRHVKCFVRRCIRDISFNDPHCPNAPALRVENALGERVPQIPIQVRAIQQKAWVDHYNTKSTEEYVWKCKRGTCCGDEYTKKWLKNAYDYYFGINLYSAEKEAILKGDESKPKRLYRRKRKEK